MKQYVITRTVDEMRNRRYVTTECTAPNMADVLAMDRVMRLHDAQVAAGELIDLASGADELE